MKSEHEITPTENGFEFLKEGTTRLEVVTSIKRIKVRIKDLALVLAITLVAIVGWRVLSAFAAGNPSSIQGQVSTFDGVPIPAVVVRLDGTEYSTTTDKDGRFLLEAISPGEYALLVETMHSGLSIPLEIGSGDEINLPYISIYDP